MKEIKFSRKMYRLVWLLVFATIFPSYVLAAPLFSLSVSPVPGDSTLRDIAVTNDAGVDFTGGLTYYANRYPGGVFGASIVSGAPATECVDSLDDGATCNFRVKIDYSNVGTAVFAPGVCYAKVVCSTITLEEQAQNPIVVKDAPKLVFYDNGVPVTSLDLIVANERTLVVKNEGLDDAANVVFTWPTGVVVQETGDCDLALIPKDSQCNYMFHVESATAFVNGDLSVSAENSIAPKVIPIAVSRCGGIGAQCRVFVTQDTFQGDIAVATLPSTPVDAIGCTGTLDERLKCICKAEAEAAQSGWSYSGNNDNWNALVWANDVSEGWARIGYTFVNPTEAGDGTAGYVRASDASTVIMPISSNLALSPLTNKISDLAVNVWTGGDSTNMCAYWTSSISPDAGAQGDAYTDVAQNWYKPDGTIITPSTCDTPLHLYCFEVPQSSVQKAAGTATKTAEVKTDEAKLVDVKEEL